MKKTYTIKYWIDEEARDHAISHTIEYKPVNKDDAIEEAKKVLKDGLFACVEAISSDEGEGDYGVIYHYSEGLEIIWNDDGSIKSETNYKDGKLEE